MAEEVCPLGGAEAREHEAEEGKTSEGAEDGFVVEIGNQRGGKEEEDVEHEAHDDVEPEDGVILLMRRFALVGQGRRETALLQHAGDIREDDQGGHLTIVVRVEDIDEPKAEQSPQQLYYAVAEASPDEALGGAAL